jgi:superoxide reductase
MTEKLQIYKCEVCGNIVEMLHAGVGEMICCNEPMKLYKENSKEAAVEKHVPVISKTSEGINVKVGSVTHPMEEAHYIEWVEVIDGEKTCRVFLKPGGKPEADFCCTDQKAVAREYCNLHGLWKN